MEERQYDLIFICRPDTPEADIDKIDCDAGAHGGRKGREDRDRRQVGTEAHGVSRAGFAKDFLCLWC